MNWKHKANLLAVLSRVPLGHKAYHWLQRVAGTNRLQLDRDLNRALELVELTLEADGHVEGSHILEVGTGWRPLVPMVFFLLGAERIVTVDVNPWLTLKYAEETRQALGSRLEIIAKRGHVPLEDMRQRYTQAMSQSGSLADILAGFNIEYQYPGDARCTGLPDASMDLVISSNVLEHIPYEIQLDIHRESNRILRAGGLAVHRFNPQDHYSTVDSTITNGNFLRYSAAQWHWYGGSGLAYHNRLRDPDYRRVFTEAQLD
ncbi:MAG: class I SAM-dependent methyltransferase, partial [Planctomycetaceae bacterium]|nr:class I SAM-dependent methyltransferase [Planctomycetaceae bacterium]